MGFLIALIIKCIGNIFVYAPTIIVGIVVSHIIIRKYFTD
jgi:hypothetical protein